MKLRPLLSLLIPALALAISGCSKYGYVSLSYPQAPQISLPADVNEIAVVNRSLTPEEAKDRKMVESITTGEIAGSDRLASDECIKGVFSASQNWAGALIVIPETVKLYGTGTREMPELLDWDLVEEICTRERTDALLVLETFDSNSDILVSAAIEQVNAILSTGKPVAKAPDQVNMNVSCYWRLYEPGTRTVIDQYQHNSHMSFDLVNSMPPPDALPKTAYSAGVSYVNRFLPSYYTVKRDLYKRTSGSGKQALMAGFRRAEVGNWTGAMEVWDELTDNEKQKTAGRACLNIAVANEVLGNTGEALKWAQRSYEFYDDKLGRDYAKVLLRRQRIEGE